MHLWREMGLAAAVSLLAGWALPWPAPVDLFSRLTGGLVMSLPFQAGYAIASMAGKRAPAWFHAGAGLLLLAWTEWAAPGAFTGAAGGPALRALLLAGGPILALAALALAGRAETGRRRAAAAALFLWGVGILGTRLVLMALVPGPVRPAAAQVLGWVGGAYGVGRLAWALLQPMAVDLWFRPRRESGNPIA